MPRWKGAWAMGWATMDQDLGWESRTLLSTATKVVSASIIQIRVAGHDTRMLYMLLDKVANLSRCPHIDKLCRFNALPPLNCIIWGFSCTELHHASWIWGNGPRSLTIRLRSPGLGLFSKSPSEDYLDGSLLLFIRLQAIIVTSLWLIALLGPHHDIRLLLDEFGVHEHIGHIQRLTNHNTAFNLESPNIVCWVIIRSPSLVPSFKGASDT